MNSDLVRIGLHSRKYYLTHRGYDYLRNQLLLGKSYTKLAEVFDINCDTLSALAKENKIHIDNRRKYFFNERYFQHIDSMEKAYWLGFLDADGNIDKKKLHLSISLQRRDANVLYKFRASLDSMHPIEDTVVIVNDKEYLQTKICITSRKMCEDLCNHGCVPNKSLILKPPSIQEEFIPGWILGYMDGDGSIKLYKDTYTKRLRIGIFFTGTFEVLSFIKQYFGNNAALRQEHRCQNNTYNFSITETNTLNFLKQIYSTPPLNYISLDRKRDKFIQYLKEKGEYSYGGN